jgi:predicted transglutaminase-like cysteine proteinase
MRRAIITVTASIVVTILIVSTHFLVWQEGETENQQIVNIKKFLPRMLKRSRLLLRKENFQQLSPYQAYVTPNNPAVQELAAETKSSQQAYSTAVQWVWVSDSTLNGTSEKWLMPEEFLTNTPNYSTNPARGRKASDCEEQAYTLVSLLRAIGVPAQNVRVVVGKVNFSGEVGGHAWAEIYEDGQWFALEATSGPYWDDEEGQLHESGGYPFTYYKTHRYPSLEIWGYFNDLYYYNPSTGEGNAPASWRTSPAA